MKKADYILFEKRVRDELAGRYNITPANKLAKEWGVSTSAIFAHAKKLKLGRHRSWSYRGFVIIRNTITNTKFERIKFVGKEERSSITDLLTERYHEGLLTGRFELSIEVL